jgi:dCTP deaminase
VPFGKSFILHPKYFVLGVTLEWIRLPKDIAGYVIGKSSWGRLGLIIATAVGVHPGFAGCLTLELSNVGELPIELKPGMQICQLFLHTAHSTSSAQSKSLFVGQRKPHLGEIKVDEDAKKLIEAYQK